MFLPNGSVGLHLKKLPHGRVGRDARQQEASGEMWGRHPSSGFAPMVEAYRGPLPVGKRGVEFITDVSPDPGGVPKQAKMVRAAPWC